MAISTSKDHPENSPAGQQAKARATAADQSSVTTQELVDAETEKGFRGVEVDSTPNENYTVAGVTSGAPTPETDEAQAEVARKDMQAASTKAAGVAER